jgi:rhodanese-related sulfurtransferase
MKEGTAPIESTRRLLLALPVAAAAIYLLGKSDAPKVDINIKEVMIDEAKALIAAGALIVDVRARAAYETKHLAGAILAPLHELEGSIPTAIAAAKAIPIVVYCGDGITTGPAGTAALNKAGFAQAVNLKRGIEGWVAAGLPVEHGAPNA